MRFAFLLVFVFLYSALVFSCRNAEVVSAEQEKPLSGLLTFTDSGITFLECSSGERFRVLDVDHALMQAAGNLPMRVNRPLFAVLEGSIAEHKGEIEFEKRFEKRFEVTFVHLLEEEIPEGCRKYSKPLFVFSNPEHRISLTFNFYVPAAILAKPFYGRLIYFPFDDEDYPELNDDETALLLSAQGTNADMWIKREDCSFVVNGEEFSSTHVLILDFEGNQYRLCLEGERLN